MKETRLYSACSSISPLEYQEAGGDTLALLPMSSSAAAEPPPPVVIGVPADEVERRLQVARAAAVAEADQRTRSEIERLSKSGREKVTTALKAFEDERTEYFKRVEGEVVQLSLAIARKILQREANLDPTLLTALVRIALENMQCGSEVRIRVAEQDAEVWQKSVDGAAGSPRWEIYPEKTLAPGDCVVETELGTANFGFEAQLRDVEESFSQLLAHRPDARSRHAAGA